MPGMSNVTALTMENLTKFANETTYSGLAVRVNWDVYDGWLYFILLCVMAIIIYIKLNDRIDNPVVNLMYCSAAVTMVSLFLRAIEVTQEGVIRGLLSDKHMWVFPLITICIAGWLWATREN